MLKKVCDDLLKTARIEHNSSTTKNYLKMNALKSLSLDGNIDVKDADKGWTVDSNFYKSKILDMLNNDEF